MDGLTLTIESPDDLDVLAGSPELDRVLRVEFTVTAGTVIAETLRALPNVRSVTFVDDENALQTVRTIDAQLPNSVRAVNFAGYAATNFNDYTAAILCGSPRVAQLEHLALYNCNLSQMGALAIANGTFEGLRALRLGLGHQSRNLIGANGVIALAKGTALKNLETLELEFNEIGDRGVAALCKSALVHQLTLLDLSHNGITSKGLARLAATGPARLRVLRLTGNQFDERFGSTRLAARLDELTWGFDTFA
jgi:hypothetical protein